MMKEEQTTRTQLKKPCQQLFHTIAEFRARQDVDLAGSDSNALHDLRTQNWGLFPVAIRYDEMWRRRGRRYGGERPHEIAN